MIVPNLAPGGFSPNRVTSESTSTDDSRKGRKRSKKGEMFASYQEVVYIYIFTLSMCK